MIKTQDISVKESEVVQLANDVKVRVFKVNGSKPSAMTIRTGSSEIEIADFAGGRFSADVNGLVPTVEVVFWKSKTFIVGLPAVVVAGGGGLLKYDLFRNKGEDTGFYRTEWLEMEQRLFCIYESGIAAWNDNGKVLWHNRKSWDDIFTGADADGLVLLMHDGQRIVIDPTNGSQEPPRNLPPS